MPEYRKFLGIFILVLTIGLMVLSLGCSQTEAKTAAPSEATHLEQADQLISIVIYTDSQCPNCEKLHSEVETEVLHRYVDSGLARLKVRVLGALGPESVLAAEAALSAADQGRFWEYRDAILKSWLHLGKPAYSRDELIRIAKEIGRMSMSSRGLWTAEIKEPRLRKT